MGNIFSTVKKLDIDSEGLECVVHSYFSFLREISLLILHESTSDLSREKIKFEAVKKELCNFLVQHEKFYRLKKISLESDANKILFSLDISYTENIENSLKVEDVLKLTKETEKDQEMKLSYPSVGVRTKIVKTIKSKLKKSVITNEEITQFLENNFLVDKENLGTACCNYKELQHFIDSRAECYFHGKYLIENVINSYLWFIRQISLRIVGESTNDLNREKRKFEAVKKELFNFLVQHKKFYELKKITLKSNAKRILFSLNINYPYNIDNSLKIKDVVKFAKKCEKYKQIEYHTDQVEAEIVETIKSKLKKSLITKEDIQQFLENNFLVDKENLGTKCSNYKELSDYIDSRVDNYFDEKVSIEHINNISFTFQGSIKNFEDEKSCGVCLEDYEGNQEVCRLPCNHFCCRNCTEEMFAIPKEYAYFQCPICRDDCT